MKYAVLRIQGKQYSVTEGDSFMVDKLPTEKVEPEVLLLVNEDKIQIGKPLVKEAKIDIKIEEQLVKGEKLEIYKFKAKSRYKRHTGFRPQYSKLLVKKIS